jgi:cell division protein FtsB
MPSLNAANRRKRQSVDEQPVLRKLFRGGYGAGASTKMLRILGWGIALWFVAAVLFGDSGMFSIIGMRGIRSDLEGEISILEEVKAETSERRDDLETDPWTIEKVAREDCGMIKDGEIVYLLEDEEKSEDE